MENMDKSRSLILALLDRMTDEEFYAIGGDMWKCDKDGNIHFMFNGGDGDVAIVFQQSTIRLWEK